jgi:hypothetical protein
MAEIRTGFKAEAGHLRAALLVHGSSSAIVADDKWSDAELRLWPIGELQHLGDLLDLLGFQTVPRSSCR